MLPAAVRCRSSHARTGVTVPCACRYALSATGASPCSSPILHAHASLSVTVSSSGAGAPPSCMHRLSYDICRRDSSSHGGPGTSKPAPMARAAPSLGGLHQWLPSNHHPPEATRASYVQNPPWCHVTTSKYVRSGHLGAMQRVLLLLLPPSQRTAERARPPCAQATLAPCNEYQCTAPLTRKGWISRTLAMAAAAGTKKERWVARARPTASI